MTHLIRTTAHCALVACAIAAAAGDLQPPGEPASTLPQVEPRRPIRAGDLPLTINQRGSSWYFTENIAFPTMDAAAVTISERYVTIDFNGFSLEGPSGISGGANSVGILGTSTAREVTICNGTIASFGNDGIRLSARGATISDMHIFDCGDEGIELGGENGRVTYCTVQACTGDGVVAESGALVQDCVMRGNNTGIRVADGSAVANCIADHSTGIGPTIGQGIFGDSGVTISNCTVTGNASEGILLFTSGTVTGCTASSNGADGIYLRGVGGVIADSLAIDNVGFGIHGAFQANISRCTARLNEVGILAVNTSSIADCVTTSNATHGVEVFNNCTVRDCLSGSNGVGDPVGAGIQVNGSDNRIDSNNLVDNDIGIRTTNDGPNVVVRNTASSTGTTVNQDHYGQIDPLTDLGPLRTGFGSVQVGPWDNFQN